MPAEFTVEARPRRFDRFSAFNALERGEITLALENRERELQMRLRRLETSPLEVGTSVSNTKKFLKCVRDLLTEEAGPIPY